jgi:hypothetical protein
MSNDIHDWYTRAAIFCFAVIVLLIAVDVVADYREGVNLGHMATEMFIMSLAASGTATKPQHRVATGVYCRYAGACHPALP